jgi:type IV secretion system protein VirB10
VSIVEKNEFEYDSADRGIPSFNEKKGGPSLALKAFAVLFVLIILLGIGGTFFLRKQKQDRKENAIVESANKKGEAGTTLPPMPDNFEITPSEDPTALQTTSTEIDSTQTDPTSTIDQAVPEKNPEEIAAEDELNRRYAAPLIAFLQNPDSAITQTAKDAGQSSNSAVVGDAGYSLTSSESIESSRNRSSLSNSITSDNFNPSIASTLSDPNFTLTQASIARCVLLTAIDSTVPGMVSCVLSDNVYSTNGRFVLLERGSKVVGQYQTGQLKQGMSRIFVLWSRVETPKGVIVTLDSPAADSLGRSGVDGKINNHFFQRFGSGMLLSVVDDVAQSAVDRQQGNDGITFQSSSQSAQDAAAIAVQNSVGIPPTLSKKQGSILNIFVARDLNFSDIYGIRAR